MIDIVIPEVGESVKEAVLAEWYKNDGDLVKKDDLLFVIETDKVTLEVSAEADGVLHIDVPEGQTAAVGATVGRIEEKAAAEAAEKPAEKPPAEEKPPPQEKPQAEEKAEKPPAKPADKPAETPADKSTEGPIMPPSVRRLVREYGLDPAQIPPTGPGGRLTKGDVVLYLESEGKPAAQAPAQAPGPAAEEDEPVRRKDMTPIRKRIAERLLDARRNTAMLTTFNDVDMSRVMALRGDYKDAFKKKHEVSLGFMSFFIKAAVAALQEFPAVNAFIDGDQIVYHDYYHLGVAVGSPRGLVVPVVRHADRLSFAAVEQAIVDYVNKIKAGKLEVADMEGGTFTITNGGVFGSLLSTPILNTPQSGILGMHRIEKRPVVVDDQVVVRPMMYLALSYDHRLVDGREAVTFLKRIKECVENPERIMMEI